MGSEPGGKPEEPAPLASTPFKEPKEPRPPLGAWPRLYAVVLGVLALEIALLKLLPSLLADGGGR